DFQEGKITLPVVLAFRRGDTEERSFWRRTLEALEHRDGDLDRAVGLMTKHGALRDTVARAGHYGAIARDALGIFPDSAETKARPEVVDFCIERAYGNGTAARLPPFVIPAKAGIPPQPPWRRPDGSRLSPG